MPSAPRRPAVVAVVAVLLALPLAALLPVLLAACGPPADGGPVGASGGGFALDSAPLARLGSGRGPEDEFVRVIAAFRQRSGHVVVADGAAHALHRFTSDGVHARTIGRRGDGPGEFRSLTWAGLLAGDSIATYDFSAGAFSVFTPDGAFVRRVALDRAPLADAARTPLWPTPLVVVPPDSVVVAARFMPQPRLSGAGTRTDSTALFVVSLATGEGRRAGTVPVRRSYARQSYSMTAPFSPVLSVAAGPGADGLLVGFGDSAVVRRLAPDGALHAAHPLPLRPAPLGAARDTFAERYLASENVFLSPAERRDVLAALEFPATFPAYRRILADETGALWVAADSTRWLVVSPAGGRVVAVTLPSALEPLQIGGDWLLARYTRTDDVQEVRVYALRRQAR